MGEGGAFRERGASCHIFTRGSAMADDFPRKKASTRIPLPQRRPSETRKLDRVGQSVFITIGYGADHLTPREIFYDAGYRSGSDMEALVSNLCIALSVMLQHEGVAAAALRKSMSQAFELRTGRVRPASIPGLLLDEISKPPEWAETLEQRIRDGAPQLDIFAEQPDGREDRS